MSKENQGNGEPATRAEFIIECFDVASAHHFGGILPSMHRFQDEVFRRGQGYAVPAFDGMSWDQWDNPRTQYIAYRDATREVRGMGRFFPTSEEYMIEKLWPHLVVEEELPHSPRVWESSRFGVLAPPVLRGRIVQHLVVAHLELAQARGIESFIGVMPPPLWERCLVRNGWPVRHLGPITTLPGDPTPVVAARFDVTAAVERNVRHVTGISHQVLVAAPRRASGRAERVRCEGCPSAYVPVPTA